MFIQAKLVWLATLALLFLAVGFAIWNWNLFLSNWQKNIGLVKPNSVKLSPSIIPKTNSKPKITPTSAPIKLIFTGDLMFDRNIRTAAKKSGNDFIFALLKPTLEKADLVIANLEGPITNFQSKSVGSAVGSPANYSFTFDPSLATTLKQHNIGLVSLGNNHILNYGQAGLTQTMDYLKSAQVNYFGQVDSAPDSAEPALTKIQTFNHQRIGFISYNQFSAGDPAKAILTEIEVIKPKVDWLIVYAHWDREYEPIALPATVKLAHQFIEAGADLIIGSHPHVIQNHEIYQGKEIYYSLGNFIFDQYFEPAVKRGMLVEAEFKENPKGLTTKPIYLQLKPGGQTFLE